MRKAFIWLSLAATAGLFLLYLYQKNSIRVGLPENTGLPVLASLGPFSLTRESGETFSSDSLAGSPWIASFIFTRCPNQCPIMMARLAALQKNLPPSIRIISFSVDPEHDPPQVLKEYAAKFGADAQRWALLTGDSVRLQAIRKEFKLGEDDDPAMHSLRFILIDEKMRVRGYYDSQDMASLKKMQEDAQRILNARG